MKAKLINTTLFTPNGQGVRNYIESITQKTKGKLPLIVLFSMMINYWLAVIELFLEDPRIYESYYKWNKRFSPLSKKMNELMSEYLKKAQKPLLDRTKDDWNKINLKHAKLIKISDKLYGEIKKLIAGFQRQVKRELKKYALPVDKKIIIQRRVLNLMLRRIGGSNDIKKQ